MKTIIFIVLAFCILPLQLLAQWEQLNGPTFGNGSDFIFEDDTIFKTGLGGIDISFDNGITWQHRGNGVVDEFGNNQSLIKLVKRDSIFIGGYSEGLFKSTDYGFTWTTGDVGISAYTMYCSSLIIKDDVCIAGFYSKIFVSTDFGDSWSQATGYDDFGSINSFTEHNNLVFGINDYGKIYYSTDGISWELIKDFVSNYQYCNISSNSQSIFAIGNTSQLFRSEDSGLTWELLNLPMTDLELRSIACYNSTILLGTQYNGVLLSEDNGDSWIFINDGISQISVNVFINDTIFFAGTGDGIFTYHENRWVSRNNNQSRVGTGQLLINNDTIITRVGGYFLSFSPDDGENWESINSGMQYELDYQGEVRDFIKVGNNFFRVSVIDGVSYMYGEHGNWEQRNNGIDCSEVAQIEYDGSALFVTTHSCGVYKSYDWGLNWVSCWPEVPNELIDASFFMDGLNGIIGLDSYTMTTTDGGETWTNHNSLDFILDSFICGDVAIVGSYYYGCFVSFDNLQTWTCIPNGLPIMSGNPYYDVCEVFTDGENFFCGTQHFGIYVYLNGTWAPVNYGLSQAASNQYMSDIASNSGYLYLSSSYGGIWKRQISEMISRPFSGYVYRDFEDNGVPDETDMPLEDVIIHVVNSNGYYTSDEFGNYFAYNDYPIDTIMAYANCNYSVSSPEYYLISEIQDSLDFAIYIKPGIHDLSSNITQYFPPVPGFEYWQMLTYANLGTESESGYVELNYDQNLILDQVFPVPDFINDYCLRWNFENLDLFQSSDIILKYFVPTSLELEQNLCFQTMAFPLENDTIPINNFDTLCTVVVGSFDPNLKEVNRSSIVSPEFIANQEELIYTIYFQNTGTAPAINISIIDTLSPNLFIPSFRVLSSSHNYDYSISGPGIVEFSFEDIMLPDSNTNEPLSHGFLKYSVKPLRSLVIGDEINNTAHIYFDFNEAVVTNTTSNIVSIIQKVNAEKSEFTYSLYPNPVTGILNIETDCSGIKNIRIVNSQGSIVKTKNMHTTSLQLDCSDLLPGLYIVLIGDESDKIRFKFVKQ